jgi:hypothetical protein
VATSPESYEVPDSKMTRRDVLSRLGAQAVILSNLALGDAKLARADQNLGADPAAQTEGGSGSPEPSSSSSSFAAPLVTVTPARMTANVAPAHDDTVWAAQWA